MKTRQVSERVIERTKALVRCLHRKASHVYGSALLRCPDCGAVKTNVDAVGPAIAEGAKWEFPTLLASLRETYHEDT
jgi:hypothetical protein